VNNFAVLLFATILKYAQRFELHSNLGANRSRQTVIRTLAGTARITVPSRLQLE
jgi:hypothetical protein